MGEKTSPPPSLPGTFGCDRRLNFGAVLSNSCRQQKKVKKKEEEERKLLKKKKKKKKKREAGKVQSNDGGCKEGRMEV